MVDEIEIISTVLADEARTRLLVKMLQDRGMKISMDPKDMTHAELVELCIFVRSELARFERSLTDYANGHDDAETTQRGKNER